MGQDSGVGQDSRVGRAAVLCLCLGLGGAICGCSHSAEFVHPEFESYGVQHIGVFDVENETVYQLNDVSFGGILQRGFFGVRQYNIPAVLRSGIEAALLRKSYETLALGKRPEGDVRGTIDATSDEESPAGSPAAAASTTSGTPPLAVDPGGRLHDAELTCRIVFWQGNPGARPEMKVAFRLELYSVAGREKLYAGTFTARYKQGPRGQSQVDVARLIRTAVIGAFSDLPAAARGED